MRWWGIPLVIAFAWFAFTLTPLWALYDLSVAVRDRDADYVERHVNFRALRFSLAQQIAAAIRSGGDGGNQQERQRYADAAMAIALTVAESLVTPQTVIDLLDDGWPQRLEFANPPADGLGEDGLRVPDGGRLAQLYAGTQMRGFRTVVVAVPPGKPAKKQFHIRMRIRDWSWRVIDIELTDALRERIGARFAKPLRMRDANPGVMREDSLKELRSRP